MVVNIGLIGRKRTGKDTAADHLVKQYGYTKLAFADPLRDLAMAVAPIVGCGPFVCRLDSMVATYGYEVAKDRAPEIRRTLQRLGNGVREVLGEDVWVDALVRRVGVVSGPVVVPDVRYPNEARALHDQGFVLVQLIRPSVGDGDRHISEVSTDSLPTDMSYRNEGTVEDLLAYIDSVVPLLNSAINVSWS